MDHRNQGCHLAHRENGRVCLSWEITEFLSLGRGESLQGLCDHQLWATFFGGEEQTVPQFGHSAGEGPDSKVFLVSLFKSTLGIWSRQWRIVQDWRRWGGCFNSWMLLKAVLFMQQYTRERSLWSVPFITKWQSAEFPKNGGNMATQSLLLVIAHTAMVHTHCSQSL